MGEQSIIIGAGIVIIVTGTFVAISEERSPVRIIGGGFGVMLLLSLLAASGQQMARLAAGLAVVTASTVVMVNALPLLDLASSLGKE